MEKIKKVIFTFTGEYRPAKLGESFFDNGLYRTWDNGLSTMDSYMICIREEIEEQWKPKEGEKYYFIEDCTTINHTNYYSSTSLDRLKYESGNIFRTREATEKKLEQIKEILLK